MRFDIGTRRRSGIDRPLRQKLRDKREIKKAKSNGKAAGRYKATEITRDKKEKRIER